MSNRIKSQRHRGREENNKRGKLEGKDNKARFLESALQENNFLILKTNNNNLFEKNRQKTWVNHRLAFRAAIGDSCLCRNVPGLSREVAIAECMDCASEVPGGEDTGLLF